ncbi:hypothetical protein [Pseudooceanicola sp.]
MENFIWLMLDPIGVIVWAGGCLAILLFFSIVIDLIAFWRSN